MCRSSKKEKKYSKRSKKERHDHDEDALAQALRTLHAEGLLEELPGLLADPAAKASKESRRRERGKSRTKDEQSNRPKEPDEAGAVRQDSRHKDCPG